MGFRSSPEAQLELQEVFGLAVVALELVDPRFYHLDTALAVLDSETIAYYPPAFSPASRERLAALYPDAILASHEDGRVLGLNATSDGRHVVMAAQAEQLAEQFATAGFEPVLVDMSELLKAGGGVKCATLELHAPPNKNAELGAALLRSGPRPIARSVRSLPASARRRGTHPPCEVS